MLRSRFVLESGRAGARGPALVRLSGPVDAVDRPALDRLLSDLAGVPDVRLDVSDVAFAGSAFADFLDRLAASARRAGGRLRLSGVVPLPLSRLLVLSGLDDRVGAAEAPSAVPAGVPPTSAR